MTEIFGSARARSVPRNSGASSLIMMLGLAATWLALPSNDAESIFDTAAIGVGIALVSATAMEAFSGVRALIRTDNLMLWVLYGLTLLEFLFPQPDVNMAVSVEVATRGTGAVLLGFFGLVVGRNLVSKRPNSNVPIEFGPGQLFALFISAFVVGYLHIFLAVNFDPLEMIWQMSGPRFSQSWGRGKYGNLYSLLYELGLLIYILPPAAGLIFARAKQFSAFQKLVVSLVLLLTFYYAFSSGTRNVLGTYVISMFGAYALSKPDLKLKQVLIMGLPIAGILLFASTVMLEFRAAGGVFAITSEVRYYDTLYIDHNIVNLSNLTKVFPDAVDFLGLEIPYQTIIRPIPRALWPGKPEGLSTGIEEALGATDGVTTLSCTFIGEAYMAFGFIGVLIAGLMFGSGAALWNRVGQNAGSSFFQVLYASGFLCAAMAMRSMLAMVPFMLPTLALWLFGRYWLPRSKMNQSENSSLRRRRS
jgi:oligosaccharide repeat unit polymerase